MVGRLLKASKTRLPSSLPFNIGCVKIIDCCLLETKNIKGMITGLSIKKRDQRF